MSRPGTTITRSMSRTARSARTRTGAWFIAGITGTADVNANVRESCKSLTEYATRFGSRAAHVVNDPTAVMYDEVDAYFADGGSEVFVSRTVDAVDATLTAALALFTTDLGPGQVSAPGRVTAAQHLILDAHADLTNRIAICDAPNTAVVATLTALATPAGVTTAQERVASLWAPWVTVPPAASGGGNRLVPPSAIVAAAMSRNDTRVSPNQPSAGALGVSPSGLSVSQSWTDVDRTTLNANGVNVIRDTPDGVKIFGYRTLADPTTDADFINLGNARLLMKIQDEADSIAQRFVFREIDGQGRTITEYGGALTGMLVPYWERGSLYGTSPSEAFRVDVGPNINTEATIANKELRAVLILRLSEFAEEVRIELVKTRITETV